MEKKYDNLFKATALLFIKYQTVGTSLIQRKFVIGYNRAGRIFDQLHDAGIIKRSDAETRSPHQLLIKTESDLYEFLNDKDLGEQLLESKDWDKRF